MKRAGPFLCGMGLTSIDWAEISFSILPHEEILRQVEFIDEVTDSTSECFDISVKVLHHIQKKLMSLTDRE